MGPWGPEGLPGEKGRQGAMGAYGPEGPKGDRVSVHVSVHFVYSLKPCDVLQLQLQLKIKYINTLMQSGALAIIEGECESKSCNLIL